MPTEADVLRVAISGCHRMLSTTPAGHNWASGFAAVPETKVVAVFDRGAETREQFRACWRETWGSISGYDDYDRMLAETQPDIVCVTTRQTMHADQIEAAVRAGAKGIACEKPFATSLAEADRIVNACQRAKVPLAYLLDRRWMAAYPRLRTLLSEGAVGTITGVLAFGVGNLINHGCHWYDTAMMLAGDPELTWASGLVDDLPQEPPDSRRRLDPPGDGWVGLDNGAYLKTSTDGGPGINLIVLGTSGRLMVLNEARLAYLWEVEGPRALAQEPRMVEPPPPSDHPWPAGPAAVRDLVRAVREGGTTACDVQEARRATEIGFAIYASHAVDGARIPLPVKDRTLRIESFPWGNE